MEDLLLQNGRQAWQKLLDARKILLVTHHNPDGDGLGSLCALFDWLESRGKAVDSYCYDSLPTAFDYLPHSQKLLSGSIENLPPFADYDAIAVLDCGSLARTKLEKELRGRRPDQIVIEFDHHPRVDDYADIELRDPSAAATSELLYRFGKDNHLAFSKNVAQCLLTGLLTDTANFFYPSASTATIAAAAELVLAGGRLPQITESTLKNKSLAGLKLWGEVMASLEINHRYNFGLAVLPRNEELAKVPKEELDGISGFLSNLYGVKGILFLQEEAEGRLRGSLRTADPAVNLSRLARLLGGGGHPKAAGFSLQGRLIETEQGWRVG